MPPNGMSLSFRGHQNNAVLRFKTNANAGMAQLLNLGAGMDLARSGRFEDVKKRVSNSKDGHPE